MKEEIKRQRYEWVIYNSFTGDEYISCTGGIWDRLKACDGYYSKLMKKFKAVNANIWKVDVRLIKVHFKFY